MNPEIMQQLVLAAALAIVSFLAFALRSLFQVGLEYLRARLGQTNYDRLQSFSLVVVKALEQSPVYKELAGEKKYELAKVAILQYAEEHRLPIDDALVDKFIEASVKEVKAQFGQIEWTPLELPAGGIH